MFASLKRAAHTLRQLVEDRAELFLLEVKEERVRFIDVLLLVTVCSVCSLMALLLITLTILVLFWDEHRLLVLLVLTLVYAGVAVWTFISLRRRLQQWQSFSGTLEQLRKDRECFGTEK